MSLIEEETANTPLRRNPDGCVIKQVLVAVLAASLQVISGFNFSYSSVIVPQLLEERNTSTIVTTPTIISWIVSVNTLGLTLSGLISGLVVDRFGRVKTMRFLMIPSVLGWFLVAIAPTTEFIIVGLFIAGFFLSFLINSVYVYIAEVSQPNIRGALLSLSSLFVSTGIFLLFVQGRYLHWRWIAWVIIAYTVILTMLLCLIPESPPWLVSKNRIKQATQSLNWFFKAQNQLESGVDVKLLELVNENEDKMRRQKEVSWNTFTQPTVYKPFFILFGLFTFQQYSGVYGILANCVIFFKKIGVRHDPYLITIFVGVTRIIAAIVFLWLSKVFNRRTLLCASGLGMAASLSLSALTTKWIQQSEFDKMWVPVVLILLYFFFAGSGLIGIPFALSAELFPLNVRGLMQSLSLSVCNLISFTCLILYDASFEFFGDVVSVQCLYVIACLAFVVYTYVLVPETHNKKLYEIEEYFWQHSTSL